MWQVALFIGLALQIQMCSGHAQDATSPAQLFLVVTPSDPVVFSGPQGGPFSPSSVQYRVRASTGRVSYSIRGPAWLSASVSVGSTDTSGVEIAITLSDQARRLPPGTYGPGVAFTNTTNGRGSGVRRVVLIVQPRSVVGAVPPRSVVGPARNGSRERLLDNSQGVLLDDLGGALLAR